MAITVLTDSDYSALFKRTYGEYGDNLYGSGSEDVLESQITKKFDFNGADHRFPVKVGFGGGTGYSVLPEANSSKNVEVILTRKKAYARMNLDRETIVASRGKDGAFKEATSEETLGKLKSFNRTQACTLYNDGSGVLGQFSGTTGTTGTAAAPTLTIINTGTYRFRQGYFEEGDYVQVVSGGVTLLTSKWEITAVDVAAKTVTLSRISGGDDLTAIAAGTHNLVLQGAWNAAPQGLLGVHAFTSSTLYGVTYARRWASYKKAYSTSTLISVDVFNEAILQMDQRCGQGPDLIILSTIQMQKFLSLLEDKKTYPSTSVSTKSNKLANKASVSFSGIMFQGPTGDIPIMSSRYVRDDMAFLCTTDSKYMFRKHAEKFGWFDEDRTVLMRMTDQDAYEARYGGYYENYFNPLFQGSIEGLSV